MEMKFTFKELEGKRLEFKEHNDCSVKSVAVTCGVSYEIAHAAVKATGRKNRGTAYFMDNCKPAIESLGFEVFEERFPGKTLVTLERDLCRYARGRKFFVTVDGHFVGFDGEKFVDWAQGRRHRVKKIWRVKRKIDATATDFKIEGTVTGRFNATEPNESAKPSIEELPRGVHPVDDAKVPNWLRGMPKPQGAPKVGTRVTQHIANNESFSGAVVDYLASQFIIEMDGGRERIVAVGDDWKEI